MIFSSPLFVGSRGKIDYPKISVFSEIIPLASKNRVIARKSRVSGSSCTQELQALFGCLKKWEFDDKPCAKQHSTYMDCVHESQKIAKEYYESAKKGTLGEGEGQSMTATQFNKLMKLFPQPEMGQPPYRKMKRLPTQSYADDIFHRKHMLKKPS